MALNETVTDIWVSKMFEKEKIEATPQGTNIVDIAEALKSASKNGAIRKKCDLFKVKRVFEYIEKTQHL